MVNCFFDVTFVPFLHEKPAAFMTGHPEHERLGRMLTHLNTSGAK